MNSVQEGLETIIWIGCRAAAGARSAITLQSPWKFCSSKWLVQAIPDSPARAEASPAGSKARGRHSRSGKGPCMVVPVPDTTIARYARVYTEIRSSSHDRQKQGFRPVNAGRLPRNPAEIRLGFREREGIGRTFLQPAQIGREVRVGVLQRRDDHVGIEQGRRGGAVGQREGVAGGPLPSRHGLLGDREGGGQRAARLRHAVRIL